MVDNLTKRQRSHCMSKIRSKWTAQEKKIHNFLKGNKIKHKMHPNLFGSPDILLTKTNTIIFLNGCFWHRCPKCFKKPKSNRSYWTKKIMNNVSRDKSVQSSLKKDGYKIRIIWEHDINNNIKTIVEKLKTN